MNLPGYNHCVQLRVRTFDVDSQGIVHNMNYLKYFEIGRVEYRRNLGYHLLHSGIFNDGLKVVVVRNELDYRSFLYLDDIFNVFTKVSWIKKSSFCFDQIIARETDASIISECMGVLVNINSDNESEKLSEKFIRDIKSFEQNLELK